LSAVTVPSASTTTTPVPTVSRTVSMRRRRSSSSRFFRVRPARLVSTSSSLRARRSDMRLNEAISAVNSSSLEGNSTRTPRSPAAMRSVPSATSRRGVVIRRARYKESHTAPKRMSNAGSRYRDRYTALIGSLFASAFRNFV
jgi:hypothetical protein